MQKTNWKIPRWLKYILALIGFVIVLILAGNIYLKNLVNRRIKEIVLESSDSLYRIEYDRLSINLATGNVNVYNFKLIPDTKVFHALIRQHRAPILLVEGEVSVFMVKGVQWWNYLRTNKFIASQIAVTAPHINLLRYRLSKSDSLQQKHLDLYAMLSKQVKDLKVGSVLLRDASLTYEFSDTLNKRRSLIQFDKLGIFINNLHIDVIKAGDSIRNIFADQYLIKLDEYRYRTADSLYWLVWKDVEYNSRNRDATLSSFAVIPRYEEKDFWLKVKTRKERFDMELKKIRLDGLEGEALLNDGKLTVRHMSIGSGKLEIFQNKSLPFPAADKKNVCFSQKIMQIKFPLLIDTLEISGINFHYKEFNPKSGEVGHLLFNDIKGKVLNITNTSHDIRDNAHMRILLSANFMEAARLKTDFDFLLDAPDGKFQLDAELNKIDATKLNRASKGLAKIELEQGIINKLNYHAYGNENYTTGNIDFLYEDLKINFLEPDSEDGELQKQGLKSFLANIFIIKDQNPQKGEIPRRALNITTQRHPKKGYFSMIWRTLFRGLKDIISAGKMSAKKTEKKGKKSS